MSDTEETQLAPGTVLADRYELTEEIGRGGFGMVHRARQMNMDRAVAIKILPPKFMSIPDVVERFRREARLASRLRHPNTITVHDYGKHENLLFIVMELLEGEDLADVLMRKPTVSMDRIVHIGRQVLKSLNEAHQHKIIHRDLKPENIFLTSVGGETDFVKVLDFGIAKLTMPEVSEGDEKHRKLTMSGSTVGTPTYMSPEQAAGEEVDALTDLYALGVILYEMACGRPPFKDDNPVKVMRSHLFEEVPRLPKGPLRDSRFESVIRRALAKDKAERLESAKEFLEALKGSPTALLERGSYDVEPPTVELPDLDSDEFDSGDLAYSRTAAYDVEGSDVLSPRSPHDTESMLAAQEANAPQTGESIPFKSVPEGRDRDRVPEGAVNSSLTDISGLNDGSGLTSRSDLHAHQAPTGFESGASSSSIITVLEPGPQEDVILLTKKKDDDDDSTDEPPMAQTQEAPSSSTSLDPPRSDPSLTAPPTRESASPVEPSIDTSTGEHLGQEWSWGDDGETDSHEMLRDEFAEAQRRTQLIWTVAIVLVLVAAGIVGYLNYAGHIEIF